MPTVYLEARISSEQLLKAVDQLSATDLEALLHRVLSLQAGRRGPASSEAGGERSLGDAISPNPGEMSGAEMLAYWEEAGVLQAREDIPDGPTYARQLREQAQQRTQE